MDLDRIVERLDAVFQLDEFAPDTPFSSLVPSVYEQAGIDLTRYLTPRFLQRFHGLMVRASQSAKRVYSAVFLSDEILDKVFAQRESRVLVIAHHPLVMETSGRGFLPLSGRVLDEMQERGISVYVLHTPLDVHDEISTGRALTKALGLGVLRGFYPVLGRSAGLYGRFAAFTSFDELLARVAQASGVQDLHFVRRHDTILTAAVIPGGTDVAGILKATELGCDVLVTGTYWNQVQTEIGQRYRDEFASVRDDLTISLVECSHYASEAIVMHTDMVDLCERLGLACEFIPQDDPWY
jgi:putative NIF3 family GTP cyclohydrolase 1 type 2